MKKNIYLLLIILFTIIFFQCSVNEYTGLIQVKNHSNTAMKNVKVGNTIITSYLAPGNYVDYWFTTPIKGVLTEENLGVHESQENIEWELKPNYWITIFARQFGDGSETVVLTYSKNGTKDNEKSLVSED